MTTETPPRASAFTLTLTGDLTRCASAPAANLTISQSAVLLDVAPADLLRMILDPGVDAEPDWHIVREGCDIRLPVWFVRDLLTER